jgi:peptidoglycan/xylan/chitin deacetylase (PgdA/CDA1 family)
MLPTATALLVATQTATASTTATPFPEPTLQWGISRTVRVPILMYHYISTPPEDANEFRVDLSVEPAVFQEQMAYLAYNGYTAIDLYDLTLAIAGKAELPPKPVIITLDDGYRDAYEHAFPILKAYGHKATIFVITELADQGAPTHLTWPMIEEMAAAGMRMEPHTKTHEDLRERTRESLIWQIRGSQETLAAHLGYTPRYLAYPGGRYDDQVLQVVRELDLWGAVTTAGGWWHGYEDRYEWRRLRVRNATTLSEFDWMLTNSQ